MCPLYPYAYFPSIPTNIDTKLIQLLHWELFNPHIKCDQNDLNETTLICRTMLLTVYLDLGSSRSLLCHSADVFSFQTEILKCIPIVRGQSTHCIFESHTNNTEFTTAGRVCVELRQFCLQIPAPSNLIGRNKYDAKEGETPPSPRSELFCIILQM